MPDPIEDLRGFAADGVDVAPLPPAEVRRRGERRRRRTTAVATAGGVAAAVVLAVPLVLAARGADRSAPPQPLAPPSSTAGPGWRQSIPSDLDLRALPAGAGSAFGYRSASDVEDLSLCGRVVFSTRSTDVVDSAAAAWAPPGTDGSSTRALVVYRDEAAAVEVLSRIEDGVAACPVQRQAPGAPLLHEVVDTELPANDSLVLTRQARMGGGLLADLTVHEVARVGNAVYLATATTAAGGPQVVASEVRRLTRQSAPVLDRLCTFARNPC